MALTESGAPYDFDAHFWSLDFEFFHAFSVLNLLAFEKRIYVKDTFAATHSDLVSVAVVQVVSLVDGLAQLGRNKPASICEIKELRFFSLFSLFIVIWFNLNFDVVDLCKVFNSYSQTFYGLGGGEALALSWKFFEWIRFLFELAQLLDDGVCF